MPQFERQQPATGPVVAGFTATGFRVGENVCPGGLMLTPEKALDWQAPLLEALLIADLAPVLTIDPLPEFLLLGTGPSLRRPAPALVAAVEAQGIGVEAMDSRAAARAWGLLRAEGRHIAAALLPLG